MLLSRNARSSRSFHLSRFLPSHCYGSLSCHSHGRSLRTPAPRWSSTAPTSATKLFYQHDSSLRSHSTRVLQSRPFADLPELDKQLFKHPCSDDAVVTTDETIFHPQGGGQPYDTGEMTSTDGNTAFHVSAVRNSIASPGMVLHLGRFPYNIRLSTFAPGQSVTQVIDSDRRDTNSRLHTGGHVVALAVRKLLIDGQFDLLEQGASHFPNATYVIFKGSIKAEHEKAIQTQVNAFVDMRLPVTTHWWTEEELRRRCATVPESVVSPTQADEQKLLRAVDIVGAGAYACGGTHVKHLGEVGRIIIRKISRAKGHTRVSYSIDYPSDPSN